jgi:rhodanese-related sulfurtransferase
MYEIIDAAKAAGIIASEKPVILDVRTAPEIRENGHLAGAR